MEGPFFEAFTKGYILLLDELNLASKTVLCALQEAIGSWILSITISGKGYVQEIKHENFCLIATQNPNKEAFKGKRQFGHRFSIMKYHKVWQNNLGLLRKIWMKIKSKQIKM